MRNKDWKPLIDERCIKGNYRFLGYSVVKHGKQFINVLCIKHKETCEIRVDRFVGGAGCIRCRGDNISNNRHVKTTEEAVFNMKAVHGKKFDYSKSIYCPKKSKMIIGCPEHGEFLQKYHDHLKSPYGCPSCAKFGFKVSEPATLYLLSTENLCKVGITNNDIGKRVQQINTSGGKDFKVVDSVYFTEGNVAQEHEKFILNKMNIPFGDKDCYSGSTEVTDISNLPEILQYMKGLKEKYE